MKNRLFLFLFPLIVASFFGCQEDNDLQEPQYFYAMATAYESGYNPIFVMDDSTLVMPMNDMPTDSFIMGQRYFLFFAKADTAGFSEGLSPIFLTYYRNASIANMEVLHPDSLIGPDPHPITAVQYVWYSGHYLNLAFETYRSVSEHSRYRLVRILSEENNELTDREPTLVFELRHESESVYESARSAHYMSFDVANLGSEYTQAEKFHITLKCKSEEGGFSEYEYDYQPDETP